MAICSIGLQWGDASLDYNGVMLHWITMGDVPLYLQWRYAPLDLQRRYASLDYNGVMLYRTTMG